MRNAPTQAELAGLNLSQTSSTGLCGGLTVSPLWAGSQQSKQLKEVSHRPSGTCTLPLTSEEQDIQTTESPGAAGPRAQGPQDGVSADPILASVVSSPPWAVLSHSGEARISSA